MYHCTNVNFMSCSDTPNTGSCRTFSLNNCCVIAASQTSPSIFDILWLSHKSFAMRRRWVKPEQNLETHLTILHPSEALSGRLRLVANVSPHPSRSQSLKLKLYDCSQDIIYQFWASHAQSQMTYEGYD